MKNGKNVNWGINFMSKFSGKCADHFAVTPEKIGDIFEKFDFLGGSSKEINQSKITGFRTKKHTFLFFWNFFPFLFFRLLQ